MDKPVLENYSVSEANNYANNFYIPLSNTEIHAHFDKITLSVCRKEDKTEYDDSCDIKSVDNFQEYSGYEFFDYYNETSVSKNNYSTVSESENIDYFSSYFHESYMIAKIISDVLVENNFHRKNTRFKEPYLYERIIQHTCGQEKIDILYQPNLKKGYPAPVQLIFYDNISVSLIQNIITSCNFNAKLSKIEFALDFYSPSSDRLKIKNFFADHLILNNCRRKEKFTISKTYYQGKDRGKSVGSRMYEKEVEGPIKSTFIDDNKYLRLELVIGRTKIRTLGINFPFDEKSINKVAFSKLYSFKSFEENKCMKFINGGGFFSYQLQGDLPLSEKIFLIKRNFTEQNYTNHSRFFPKIDLGFFEQLDGSDFLHDTKIRFNLEKSKLTQPMIKIEKYTPLSTEEELKEEIIFHQNEKKKTFWPRSSYVMKPLRIIFSLYKQIASVIAICFEILRHYSSE